MNVSKGHANKLFPINGQKLFATTLIYDQV